MAFRNDLALDQQTTPVLVALLKHILRPVDVNGNRTPGARRIISILRSREYPLGQLLA